MTYAEAKSILEQMRVNQTLLGALKKEIAGLIASYKVLPPVTSTDSEIIYVPTSAINKIMERQRALDAELTARQQEYLHMETAIATLSDTEQTVIRLFYFHRVNCVKIADKLHYSPDRIYQIKQEAIKHIAENYYRCAECN